MLSPTSASRAQTALALSWYCGVARRGEETMADPQEEEEEYIVMELSEFDDVDFLSSCKEYSLIVPHPPLSCLCECCGLCRVLTANIRC